MRKCSALLLATLAIAMTSGGARADETEDTLRTVAERFFAAWTALDRDTATALIAEDADMVEFNGEKYVGRTAILDHILRAVGKSKAVLRLVEHNARTITPDVAVADWLYTFSVGDATTPPIHQTVVLRRNEGAWRIAAFRHDREAKHAPGGADRAGRDDAGHAPRKPSFGPDDALRAERTKSADNLRSLVLLLVANDMGISKSYPALNGKRFVLWVVASKSVKATDANLTILFSPHDKSRNVEKAGGAAAFETLTLETLRAPETDVDRFTSYVGRLNRTREHVFTAAELEVGGALFADLSFSDGAIVAFTSGIVKWLTREELGIPAGHPIVAGPESESPLLRHLGP